MEITTVKKARKNIIWILFLSILCLILISFLPWISVAENDQLKENLYFNYEMMKGSDNAQINDLANSLMVINILFWTVIVITLISFLLITYFTLIKNTLFGWILILTSSCITFVLCVLIVYFQIIFSRLINDIDFISASMIQSPFAYAYIQFILSLILLIFSGTFAITLVWDSIKQFKNQTKQKKKEIKKIDEEKIPDISTEKGIETSLKESEKIKTSLDSDKKNKIAEIDKLLEKKELSTDKQVVDKNPPKQELDDEKQIAFSSAKKTIEDEGKTQEKHDQESETVIKEDNNLMGPFPPEEKKEKSEETDEIRLSEHFEKALSSAIEKKQSKMKLKESDEKNKKHRKKVEPKQMEQEEKRPVTIFKTEKILLEKKGDTINKVFNVKCPECNHIFPFDIESDTQKITCPKCGKEGTLEKEI